MGRRGRSTRLLVEAVYVAAVAVAAGFADLRGVVAVGAVVAAWAIAAAFEWASWRSVPHYAAGAPPHYVVPYVELPPPQPLELVAASYPEAQRDEAPTWIASAELRASLLAEWPLAPTIEDEDEEAPAPAVALVSEDTQPEPPPIDPWLVAELPPAPVTPAEPLAEAPVADREADATDGATDERKPAAPPATPPVPAHAQPRVAELLPIAMRGVANYSIDPLLEPPRRRRFRRNDEPPPKVQVPARPVGRRPLPGERL